MSAKWRCDTDASSFDYLIALLSQVILWLADFIPHNPISAPVLPVLGGGARRPHEILRHLWHGNRLFVWMRRGRCSEGRCKVRGARYPSNPLTYMQSIRPPLPPPGIVIPVTRCRGPSFLSFRISFSHFLFMKICLFRLSFLRRNFCHCSLRSSRCGGIIGGTSCDEHRPSRGPPTAMVILHCCYFRSGTCSALPRHVPHPPGTREPFAPIFFYAMSPTYDGC